MLYFQGIRSFLAKIGIRRQGAAHKLGKAISRSSMLYASLLIFGLIVIGTFSYTILEDWSLLDALYATIITLTTVGYGDLSPQTVGGRVFAIFFTLTAIGIAGYAISTVAAFVIEREHERVKKAIREQRMKNIANLNDHIILCGGGYIGKRIADEFYRQQIPFVIVEENEDLLRWTLLYLHKDYVERKIRQSRDMSYIEHDTIEYETKDIGELAEEVDVLYLQEDSTQDRTLIRAGVDRAKGMIVSMDDDKQNLFVVLSARQLATRFNNGKLRIITRVIDEVNSGKLLAAGADKALSPNVMGSFQMATHMLTPELGAFLEHMLYGNEHIIRFTDMHVRNNPQLAGKTVAAVKSQWDRVVIAIKRAGEYHYTPEAETLLEPDDILIVLGASGEKRVVAEPQARY